MDNIGTKGTEGPTDLTQRVIGVIARSQRIDLDSVTIEKTFEELKIDSLDGINIVFELESEFDLDIPDDDAREIKTIRGMVEGIEALLAAKKSGAEHGVTNLSTND